MQNTIRLSRGQSLTNLVSFFTSFSLSSKSVTLSSSSKPLFPHFINLSMYITYNFNIAMCDVHKTCMVCPSYFIIHSLCIRNAPTYTKLEWFVYHVLSFTVQAHVMLQRIQNSIGLLTVFYRSQFMHMRCSNVYINYR